MITLLTLMASQPALALYLSSGFQPLQKVGTSGDTLFMRKRLL